MRVRWKSSKRQTCDAGESAVEPDDIPQTEFAAAVAAVALLTSPRLRGWLRRGAVLGVAGVLRVAGTVVPAAQSLEQFIQRSDGAAGDGLEDLVATDHNGAG